MRRRDDGVARGSARRRRARRRHRQQPRRGRQPPRPGRAALQLPVSAGRRQQPWRPRGPFVRPGRQHLRGDVRAEAVRGGQGDGARHAARGPHRHGQLDSQRPDLGGADPESERLLHATAAGRLRQPDEVGCRERRNRAVRGRGRPEGEYIVRAGHVHVQDAQAAFGVSRHLQTILWADDERFEAAEKSGRQAICQRSWTLCSAAQNKSAKADATAIPATFLRVTVVRN